MRGAWPQFPALLSAPAAEARVLSMDEGSERYKTSRGGAYLRCPVFITVQFSLRNEGSSEYIRVCEGRESLRPNF
jgi:hypothetical protein